MCMKLYLVSDDPENMLLVCGNGCPHYRIKTEPQSVGRLVTSRIYAATGPENERLVSEVQWQPVRRGCSLVRMRARDGTSEDVLANELLVKGDNSSSFSRYFLGNDDKKYRWRILRGIGLVLTQCQPEKNIGKYSEVMVREGFFKDQMKWSLEVHGDALDLDLVIITFVIMEKTRRDHMANAAMRATNRSEDLVTAAA